MRTFRKQGIICLERGASTVNKSRPRKVLIRLNDDELTQLKADIENSGMTQQDYILSKLFPKSNQVLAPKSESNETEKPVLAPEDNDMVCPKCGADLVIKMDGEVNL